MATTIQPLDYRSTFSIGLAHFLKRVAAATVIALCALAFVVMAATAADQDFVSRPSPVAYYLIDA